MSEFNIVFPETHKLTITADNADEARNIAIEYVDNAGRDVVSVEGTNSDDSLFKIVVTDTTYDCQLEREYNPWSSSQNGDVIHLAYLIDELENDGLDVSSSGMSHFEHTADKVIEYARKLSEAGENKDE